MADRYWVGNGGNWSDNTNHWSASSGGAPGASKPTSSDNVYFNANSFSLAGQTVTVDEVASCLDMVWTGAANNPTFARGTSYLLNVSGNVTFIAAMSITGTRAMSLSGTSKTLTTNGLNISNYMNFDGGSRQLLDNLTCLGINHQGGTLDTNGKTITTGAWSDGVVSTARTLTLGASVINCSSWSCGTVGANLTVTANTATINISGTGAFAGGTNYNGLTLNLNGTAHTVSGNNTFLTLRRTGTATTTDTLTLTAGTTQTCTNFACIGNSLTNRLTVQSSTPGTQATITATYSAYSNVNIQDIKTTNAYAHTENLLSNASFETGNPPTGWIAAEAGFTIAQSGAQQYSGSYSMLCTRNGTSGNGYQPYAGFVSLQGINVTFTGWARASVASTTGLRLHDGVSGTQGAYHSGNSTWEQLSVTKTLATNASQLRNQCIIFTTDTSSYFDDVSLTITGTLTVGSNCNGYNMPSALWDFATYG